MIRVCGQKNDYNKEERKAVEGEEKTERQREKKKAGRSYESLHRRNYRNSFAVYIFKIVCSGGLHIKQLFPRFPSTQITNSDQTYSCSLEQF